MGKMINAINNYRIICSELYSIKFRAIIFENYRIDNKIPIILTFLLNLYDFEIS